ncbi:hypothetical protein J2751_000826 [Halorubrum alkaliphilum]|uniref:Uncharacterized protein n=1 Tax=Halorubrum alkaliphilum TaxID=261290 RepID=A0A8T4GDM9_9EURY|nr:hypothetical protein [Halorubrum alkaliphilum]
MIEAELLRAVGFWAACVGVVVLYHRPLRAAAARLREVAP